MKLSDETREFLERNEIKNYTINPDGTIDVNGNVKIYTKQSKLPVKFGKVTGNFNCSYNYLTSLEGAPSLIGGNFNCSHNLLTSLHDIHKHIKECNSMAFYCHGNPIKSSVLGLFMVKGIKFITLDNYKIQMIINKHIDQGRAGVIGAQQDLLDVCLDEYARL